MRLTRNTNKGLVIEGKNEQIFRLIQYLTGTNPVDQTPKEKKLLLLLSLLEGDSHQIKVLAHFLGISVTTLLTYLDDMTAWVKDFKIVLNRKRGVGIEFYGNESDKRNALGSYFLQHFNEELIEGLFLLEKGNYVSKTLLYYFNTDYLLAIERIVHHLKPRLADSDYIGFVVQLCISIQRTEDQFFLEEDLSYKKELGNEYQLIADICKRLEIMCSITFTNEDLFYLAVVLKGSKHHTADVVPYDSVVLGRMIKSLVQNVSTQLHVDLTKDFALYQGLLAHMEPALFRLKQNIGMYNPLTEEIQRKYPVLFMAVKKSLEKEFKDIDSFSDDEAAFIVLHFGSALVLREEEMAIKALVVCPTGIGTSKMLASRIKKEITEIDSIEIRSLKEINRQENFKSFDIIISTVRLPFVDIPYILVSPLLTEENIQTIKNYIKDHIEELIGKKHYVTSVFPKTFHSEKNKVGIKELLQELKDAHQSIEAVLANFRLIRMAHIKNQEQIIEAMVLQAEKEHLLTNHYDVMETLKDREKKGGLGIPNTSMGLFHCRHTGIDTMIFQICHLEEPVTIKGMDGNDMEMKSLLLLLTPEELRVRMQEIVSLISTSLVENHEAIMVFSSSNEDMIRTRLESIFFEYIHTNIIRD